MATRKLRPYFEGQQQEDCGCYYPDVLGIGDDAMTMTRVLHCIRHGIVCKKIRKEDALTTKPFGIHLSEFRDAERYRLLHCEVVK